AGHDERHHRQPAEQSEQGGSAAAGFALLPARGQVVLVVEVVIVALASHVGISCPASGAASARRSRDRRPDGPTLARNRYPIRGNSGAILPSVIAAVTRKSSGCAF